MKYSARNVVLLVAILASLSGGAVVYRNIRFDAAAAALKSGDYSEAIEHLRPLAALGDREAQFLLGQVYAFGWGVRPDQQEALKWLRRSAYGATTESDPAAAAAFFIARDFAEGVGLSAPNESEAVKWLKVSAEGGFHQAAKRLADAYTHEHLGLPHDPEQASYWLDRAE